MRAATEDADWNMLEIQMDKADSVESRLSKRNRVQHVERRIVANDGKQQGGCEADRGSEITW
jgi:hypothetical protein